MGRDSYKLTENNMFKSIGLITKLEDNQVKECLQQLILYLEARNINIVLDISSAKLLDNNTLKTVTDTELLGVHCDLVIVIGGDGTLLRAARLLAKHDMRILGINLGRLGFLTDIYPAEMQKELDVILEGVFIEENRFLIHAEVYRGEQCLCQSNALNEVVIHRWNMAHLLTLETMIDGHFVYSQRADGLIISTPTGSTAYALSSGGPIIHPSLNALLIVSICPHTLSNRPIVISGDSRLQIILSDSQIGQAQLSCDSILQQEIMPGDRIAIEKRQRIRLIHPRSHDHYTTLRTKLDWGKHV
jgi:NAD+ kinase